MNWLPLLCVAPFLPIYPSRVLAQDESEPTAGVQILCSYLERDALKIQSATITASDAVPSTGSSAPIARLNKEIGAVELRVVPGHSAECIYPNGDSVRVKVGMGTSRPYGMCGADPSIFLSLWINRRKVDSRAWFAGHCAETGPLVYSLRDGPVRKCQHARVEDSAAPDSPNAAACVDLPAPESFPVDAVEYPAGTSSPAGSIEIRSGDAAVCDVIKQELTSHWDEFFGSETPLSFDALTFSDSSVTVSPPFAAARESNFDFDNDGAPDKVLLTEHQSRYMHGSTLIVNPSIDADSNLTDGWFLPCQLDAAGLALAECPPFSQAYDEAGVALANPGATEVFFRARYSHLKPFRLNDTTYVAITSESEDPREFVAIVEPQRNRSFARRCLLRKIPENF